MQRGERPTVLVVDDNADLRRLYAEILRGEYTVRTAESGEDALDSVDDSIDAVLLDRRMPGLSGDETLDRLRARGFDRPVAMVSAIDLDVEVEGVAFDDYAVKPLKRDQLRDLVAGLVRRGDPDRNPERDGGREGDPTGGSAGP